MKTFSGSSVNPGETICIPAGERGPLVIENVTGTESAPITITNSGGVAKIVYQGGDSIAA